jgi:hypothetical protein
MATAIRMRQPFRASTAALLRYALFVIVGLLGGCGSEPLSAGQRSGSVVEGQPAGSDVELEAWLHDGISLWALTNGSEPVPSLPEWLRRGRALSRCEDRLWSYLGGTPDGDLVPSALLALGQFGHSGDVPTALKYLRASDQTIRRFAAAMVGETRMCDLLVEVLRMSANDPSSNVRAAAVQASALLARCRHWVVYDNALEWETVVDVAGSPAFVRHWLLQRAIVDQDEFVRTCALEAAGTVR